MKSRQGVIFDLDQILIDGRLAEAARQARKWGEVYKSIPRLTPYPGIAELLRWLSSRGIGVGIVTSRPARYCELVVQRWGWSVNARVCFGDTPSRKPSPEPIVLCLKRLGVTAADAVLVGADVHDIRAAKSAAVFSVAAQWGTQEKDKVLEACPDAECATVSDLKELLTGRFGL